MKARAHVFVAVLVSMFMGCGGAVPGGPGQPIVGNQDQPDLHITLDEGALHASLADGELRVTLPVTVAVSADGVGHATVELLTLAGDSLGLAETGFTILDGSAEPTLVLPGGAVTETGVAEAGYVVRYDVKVGESSASGFRSLFTMLPKVDLRARLPAKLIVGSDAKVRVFAIDPFTNTPREGVPVRLRVTSIGPDGAPVGAPQVIEGVTDASGSAVLPVPGQDEGAYAWSAEAGDGAAPMAIAEANVAVERSHRVLVTTDKPIYQPGQTMHVRALVLRKPLFAADGERPLTFEILDGKGNMVFRKYGQTNAFGIAATTFKLATEVNMGHYQVKAIVGETATTKTVNVERYALPKFKLATSLDHEYYLAGDTIKGVVDARYFFGKPVVAGDVEISAASLDIGTSVFATVSGATDAEGLFTFELKLPDYLVGQPLEGSDNALVFLTVKLTDTAANVVEKTQSVVVSASAIDIMAVPESGAVVPGLDNVLHLFATDPLGRPVDATFSVTLSGEGAGLTVEPIGAGVASFATTPTGTLSFEVFAQTASGASTSEVFSFDPGATPGKLLLRSDRALYRVGDTIQVSALTTAVGGRLFVDVVKDGQTLLTDAVDVVDGVAKLALDVDPGMVGDVVIEAYQVGADASIERDSKRVFVTDAKGLQVAMSADQPTYKPGEEATLTFAVTDADGAPKVAALGVQIVDEAVYAVTEMKPGLLETYFLVQEALQTPKYEVHGVSFDMPSIVTGDPEDAVAQAKAQAGFAAIATDGVGETSSWTQVKAALPAVLSPHYATHLKAIAAVLLERVEVGLLEDPEQSLADQTDFYDFWGNAYEMTVYESWGWYATVTSRGPDEVAGTWDDHEATVLVKEAEERWLDANTGADAGTSGPPTKGNDDDGPRVRKDFPETLYVNPALITDETGTASVTLNMADSITEWRVTALANSLDGALGSSTSGVTVFQDFFVDVAFPPTLTRGDEVTFPIAIYNYLPTPQTVELTLAPASWYELTGGTNTATITLDGNQVTSQSFPVRVTEVGVHALTVTGLGSQMSDAVQRLVRVVPDGVESRDSASGMLDGTVTHTVSYPAETIPNSQQLLVKVYPGIMAQAVEGLDSLLQMPSGCFEQTTATNWPNTLVLDYLRTSGQVSPELELKALDYLQQGYQRLLTFECTGGGFVWFGDPAPANVVLSAMGVLEFSDMAKVIEVDEAVIERTANWLIGAQFPDGHWHTDQGSEFATVQYDDVKTTAFSAWALAESPHGDAAVGAALGFLTPHAQDVTTDVYSQAMMANAFAVAEPNGSTTKALLDLLANKAVTDPDGSVHWVYEGSSGNYGGGGNGTSIEVTALAVQAFAAAGQHLDLAGQAVAYLAGNKDSFGNWGSTHATILSLRAMIKSLSNKTEEGEGTVTVSVGGAEVATVEVTDENRNVFHQLELADAVVLDVDNEVTVSYVGTGNLMYQVVWSHWLPGELSPPVTSDLLAIDVSYDKTTLAVNDTAVCTATVTNNSSGTLAMVMVDLGVPPGFAVVADKLEALVKAGTIMKYEVPGQQVSLYLEELAPGEVLVLSYDLQAKFPVKAQAPGASTYLYYDTATKAETGPVDFVVE